MWKRKVLKKKTRAILKVNYWRIVAVCFLAAMMTTAYASSTTFLQQYLPDAQIKTIDGASATAGASNSEVIADTVEQISDEPKTTLFSSAPLNAAAEFMIDLYTSGKSVLFSFLKVFNSIMTDHSYWFSVFLSMGAISSLLYQFFVANLVLIGERRFFLEVRNYPQTRISKIFFLYKIRYIRNPAWIMFSKNVFQWLWNLTIIGGIIKYYEYRMIPFILAENPAIRRKDAFHLSRQLMKGNKWKFFLLHVSYTGWHFLSFLTFGIFDFIFVNPYVTGTDAELYMELRKGYILSRSTGYELLNDSLLERAPSEDELLISKALYDDSQGPYTKISYFAPQQYPVFLFSLQPPLKAVKPPAELNKKYGLVSTLFLIFAFSILGWALEGVIHLIRDGVFPNQNFLFGPWVPLYCLCGLLLLVFIRRFTARPILAFLLMTATYTLIQYILSWVLEFGWGIAPAAYVGYFLNQNLRKAISGAVYFSMIGSAFLYYLAPNWEIRFRKLPLYIRISVCIVLCTLFSMNIIYSIMHPELFSGLTIPNFLFVRM